MADMTVKDDASGITIRIPYGCLRRWFDIAEERRGGAAEQYRVRDQLAFGREVAAVLREEDEIGEGRLHRMLDEAMLEVAEQGGDGLVRRKTPRPD